MVCVDASSLHIGGLLDLGVVVHWWLSDMLTEKTRVHTKSANEIFIRRQLGTQEKEYELSVDVTLVRSNHNWQTDESPTKMVR